VIAHTADYEQFKEEYPMKYIQLLVVLVLLSLCTLSFAESPLDKGNYDLSGSISYDRYRSSGEYYTSESTDIELTPEYGYFVKDNLLIGGKVTYYYSKYEYNGDSYSYKNKYKYLGVGPLARYYLRTDKNLFPFIGASVLYTKYLGEDEYFYNTTVDTGVDIFIAKSLALEPFISYRTSNYSSSDAHSHDFIFGLRLNYFIIK